MRGLRGGKSKGKGEKRPILNGSNLGSRGSAAVIREKRASRCLIVLNKDLPRDPKLR